MAKDNNNQDNNQNDVVISSRKLGSLSPLPQDILNSIFDFLAKERDQSETLKFLLERFKVELTKRGLSFNTDQKILRKDLYNFFAANTSGFEAINRFLEVKYGIEENEGDKINISYNLIDLFLDIANNHKSLNKNELIEYNTSTKELSHKIVTKIDLSKIDGDIVKKIYQYYTAAELDSGAVSFHFLNISQDKLGLVYNLSIGENDDKNRILKNIIGLEFSKIDNDAHKIDKILVKTPNLQKLNLYNCISINYLTNWPNNCDLSKLEELDLSYCGISSQKLGKILSKALNLRKLNLTQCYEISNITNWSNDFDLSKLEELDLSSSNISAQKLDDILSKAPNLKKLNLKDCRSINNLTDWPNNCDLSKLEEIYLSDSYINAQKLGEILSKASNLKKLNLKDCHSINNLTDWPNNCDLSKLRELDLSNSYINAQKLGKILAKTPNLQKLNLTQCYEISNITNWPNNCDLSKLEELDLSHSEISTQKLSEILAKAPNLQKLNLPHYVPSDDWSNWPDNLYLSNLKEINLRASRVSTQQLGRLLAKAPNLQKLNLPYYTPSNDGPHWPDNLYLSNLKEINLEASRVSAQQLGGLLAKTPNLKILDLTSCLFLQNTNFFKKSINLPNLKILVKPNGTSVNELEIEVHKMIQNHIPENFGKSKNNFIIEKIGGPCSSDELSPNVFANKRKVIRSALNELINNKDLKLDIGVAQDLKMILDSDDKIKAKFPQISKIVDDNLKKYQNDLGGAPRQSIQASSTEALGNPLDLNRNR